MQLRDGIRVVGKNPRVWISDGTIAAAAANAKGYYSQAFVPRAWRELTAGESAKLLSRETKANPYANIGVVQLPEDLRARIATNALGDVKTLEEFVVAVQAPEFKKIERDLIATARQLLASDDDFIAMSPVINPPGLATVTIMGPTGQLLGLHLDSWDASPVSSRAQASNRISINLGREARYLLFINLTMNEILASLPEHERTDARAVQAFMEFHPAYPVVKVRVGPGEAYIAPTENMIHDGSSEGRASSDIHLTLRGHFRVEASAWPA